MACRSMLWWRRLMWRGLNRERHVAWQVPFVFGSWHGHKEPPDPLCDGLGYVASFSLALLRRIKDLLRQQFSPRLRRLKLKAF